MSGIINKVKDALHSDKDKTHDQPEGTHGHHNNRTANAADPRIDSDRDHRAAPTGAIGSHGTTTHGTTAHGTTTHGTTGTGMTGSNYNTSTNAGPHDSNMANKVDPRVDSDRDASRTVGGTTGTTGTSGLGASHGTHGTHGTTGTTGLTGASHPAHGTHGTTGTGIAGSNYNTSTNAGPHDSNMANKLDPRVDSDRDASRTVGGNNTAYGTTGTTGTSGLGASHGTHGTHGTTGTTGLGGATHGTHGTHGTTGTGMTGAGMTGTGYNTSTNAGPHDSNMANKVDPRVDSDRDASRTVGGNNTYGTTGTTGTSGLGASHGTHGTTGTSGLGASHGTHGTTGTSGLGASHGTHGTTGTTGTSGLGASHGTHAAHSGPGPAPSTAGPHKSDMMNKVDPRVDSDRDGSKTLGQDKTYSADAHKDPTDAAQVPPSTLKKHVGEPVVAHDDKHHKHGERHGSASHQDTHRGL